MSKKGQKENLLIKGQQEVKQENYVPYKYRQRPLTSNEKNKYFSPLTFNEKNKYIQIDLDSTAEDYTDYNTLVCYKKQFIIKLSFNEEEQSFELSIHDKNNNILFYHNSKINNNNYKFKNHEITKILEMFSCLLEIIKIDIEYQLDNSVKIPLIIRNNENEEQTIFLLYSFKHPIYLPYTGYRKASKFPMKGYHEEGEETGSDIKHRKKWDEKDEEKEPKKRKCDLYFLDKEI